MIDERNYQRVLLEDPCVYCSEQATGLDHIRPRASYLPGPNSRFYRRWLNSWENRAPACLRCDNAKQNRPLVVFLIQRFRDGLPPPTKAQLKRSRGLLRVQRRWSLSSRRPPSGGRG